MPSEKYRINLGNCEAAINQSVVSPVEPPYYRADTTEITADNTILTADYSY